MLVCRLLSAAANRIHVKLGLSTVKLKFLHYLSVVVQRTYNTRLKTLVVEAGIDKVQFVA